MIKEKIDGTVLESWNKISYDIIGASYKVHTKLGPGLLESVYETCLDYEIRKMGYETRRQLELPVYYEGLKLDAKYRIDLIVEGLILVEIKAVEELIPLHKAQLMTYMKLSDIKLGLLINFNTVNLQQGIKRILI